MRDSISFAALIQRLPLALPRALPLALLAACSPFQFESQELGFRHDERADRLELSILYRGLHAKDGRGLDEAEQTLSRLLAGERVFVLVDWPLVFDFDREGALEPEEGLSPEGNRLLLELANAIEVVDAGWVRDEADRLGLWQRVRLNGAASARAAIDRLIVLALLESADEEKGWEVDPRTRALWLERARSGGGFVTGCDSGLQVRLPLSQADAIQFTSALLDEETEDETRSVFVGLLSGVSKLEYANEELLIEFAPKEDGEWVEFEFDRSEWKYLPELQERLRAVETVSLDEARGRLRAE